MSQSDNNQKNRTLKMPNALILLFGVMVLMMVLTWIVPSGEFERVDVEGTTQIVADSYHAVESNPQTPFDLLMSLPTAFANSAAIIFFLFITGGSFKLISETGFMVSGLGRLVKALEGKEEVVIPILILVLGIAGSTIGLSEEIILFIPIGIALMRALGYDALVGTSTLILGAAVGFNAGVLNPFNVGVAQGIAELPLFSGIWLRILVFVIYWALTSWYIVRYARKIKADPTKSHIADIEEREKDNNENVKVDLDNLPEFTSRHTWIAATVVAGFAIMVYGVFSNGWFLAEIGSVFLTMGIISALIGGTPLNKLAEQFIEGASEMMFPALCITFASSILVVMENGFILDTIINFLSSLIGQLPSVFAASGMYIIQLLINFFIPSGSGQAAATMPIMVPLADSLDVTRQTAVLAFVLGSGFMDSIIPTSGVLMGELSLAKIPYERWIKFLWPLMTIYLIINMAILVFAHVIGYGPF